MDEIVEAGSGQTEEKGESEMRASVVKLAFGGSEERYQQFIDVLKRELPPGTGVVLRGSAVTGERHSDKAPFDADGPGTSDLDLTLVGDKIHEFYILDGYYVPGLHSKPLSDKDPDIAPGLIPLRVELQDMVKRPVNIQATTNLVLYIRNEWFGQPYLTMIEKTEGA